MVRQVTRIAARDEAAMDVKRDAAELRFAEEGRALDELLAAEALLDRVVVGL